jgi:hypothetical protein
VPHIVARRRTSGPEYSIKMDFFNTIGEKQT